MEEWGPKKRMFCRQSSFKNSASVSVCIKVKKTLQKLRMLSSVTLDCPVTKIVMISGSEL